MKRIIMATLDEIQRLSDGEFHLLGDHLLPRLEPRYRRIRTHGLNDRGQSIKGQPDSYVGDTAATCSVAVCYNVQRSGWWKKVVQDVRDAVAAAPIAREFIVVIPRNVDRDGPKKKRIDWLSDARIAVGKADLRVIDGREISRLLDTEHQDLRYEYLGIPYSRLSGPSILAGSRFASLAAVDSIKMSRRYDPERYSPRTADRELYGLWQSTLRHGADDNRRVAPIRLIALVGDSGVGKTSLACEFTRTLGKVLPVLLVQARDLMFGTEDSLVACVIHAIGGFLDPAARIIEEVALVRHLSGVLRLTVVLDGLDEAHNPEAVRKAITFWLKSRLGQCSILVATSRPEFWRMCVDPTWVRWMPNPDSGERSPVNVAERSQIEVNDPVAGIRLPGRFDDNELEAAWLRAGQLRQELFALTAEAREELRHPFTLRVFLDLRRNEVGDLPLTVTRPALLEAWLNRRLSAETMPGDRIARTQFQQALQIVASKITEANASSIGVDELIEVSRFDSARPPGPVVQRLVEANILETLPGQSDRIRFSVEAVQDFYRADADIKEIKCDPGRMADAFSCLSFTVAYPRLARIGHRLVEEEGVGNDFVRRLAGLDARMAAIVARAGPSGFSTEIRLEIADKLGGEISTRHRVRAAMAITLLGELKCEQSIKTLATRLLPPAEPHRYLKSVGARAFIKLSYVHAAAFVYRWEWFGVRSWDGPYYFKELLATIGGATAEFRDALAAQAIQELSTASGSKEHVKAVTVLAYLRDNRLVDHLAARLTANGLLDHYENHALIALGSDAAGHLFSRSVLAVGARLAPLPNDASNHKARTELIKLVRFTNYDVRYLITPAFEPHLQRLIGDSNPDVSWSASDLVKRGLVGSLLYPAAVAAASRRSHFDLNLGDQRSAVTADLWLGWWRQSNDDLVRHYLLQMSPVYPNAEVEDILMDCLESRELRGTAARKLGEYGAFRSSFRLREILAEEIQAGDDWAKSEAANALGDLRDESAVPILETTAETHPDSWVVHEAISSLGLIGNLEAEHALERLLRSKKDEAFVEMVLGALLRCGSATAVALVVQQAKATENGPQWLCKQLDHMSWSRGWTRGEYCTHIHTTPIVNYLDAECKPGSAELDCSVGFAFRQIDSPAIRGLLRKWSGRRGSPDDPLVGKDQRRRLSDICYGELRDRGDESAIGYTLDEWADQMDQVYFSLVGDHLRIFPAVAVAKEIRIRLANATTPSDTIRLVALLGRFGEANDAQLVDRFLDDSDDMVANVACEAKLRLSDPMGIPDGWREP